MGIVKRAQGLRVFSGVSPWLLTPAYVPRRHQPSDSQRPYEAFLALRGRGRVTVSFNLPRIVVA